jgi:predicted  nucleic acid-binding Zn-ribbon protein
MKISIFLSKEFQSIVMETAVELEKAGLPISEKSILRLLRRFERIHNGISDSRLEFIKTQNSLVENQAKDEELDKIGEGCSVMEYENLKIELQTISSNIDAKTEDLEKLRARYNSDVEKSKDFLKNHEILENKIKKQRQILESKRGEEQELRWQLNSMRKQKDLMRIEMDKLVQRSQLLTKAPLLRNFDKMNDGIEDVNEEINRVGKKNSQITNKIEQMSSKVSNLKSHESGLKKLDEFIDLERCKLQTIFKSRNGLSLKKQLSNCFK